MLFLPVYLGYVETKATAKTTVDWSVCKQYEVEMSAFIIESSVTDHSLTVPGIQLLSYYWNAKTEENVTNTSE